MLKRKTLLLMLIVIGSVSFAQETVDYKKLPGWLWGEYITLAGNWPMDLQKDFIIYSGKLSGYVSECTLKDDVYFLNVMDYDAKKPSKRAWLKFGGKDTISISFDNKRFTQLTKPSESRFTRINIEEYLEPIKGKWYEADNSTLYADFKEDYVLLNGEKFGYNYVVKDGRTIQLNLSGSPYGRFIQLENYTDLYMKIRASGLRSKICKRKPEMPYQVSNEFSEVPEALTGTFYSTDGKNTKWTFTPYQTTMNTDTFPLKKLRLKEDGVLLKFKYNKLTTDVRLNPYNKNYVYFKVGSEVPVFLKRESTLPDGIEMENPFTGEWFGTGGTTGLKMTESDFAGKAAGKSKFDKVLFTGQEYTFFNKEKEIFSLKTFGTEHIELTTKKGSFLYKSSKQASNYPDLKELPIEYVNNWYTQSGEYLYGINNEYVAFDKRFWTIDKISYQDQNYLLNLSYNDTICYYNKSGDYVCEIVNDKKELTLKLKDKNIIEIHDVLLTENAQELTNKKSKVKASKLVMKHSGSAVLMGYVANSSKLKSKVLTIYHQDVLFGDQIKYTATIDSAGFFKFEIPLLHTKAVWARFKGNSEIILSPNDTVLITITANNLGVSERWNMMGPNVALTQEVAPFYWNYTKKIQAKRYLELKSKYGLEPENYSLFMDSIYQAELKILEEYVDENQSSTVFTSYWKDRISIKDWDNRMRYRWMRANRGGYERFEEHPSYFNFIDSIPFADENLWLHYRFCNVVEEVMRRDSKITSPNLNGLELFEEIAKNDTSLSQENKELLLDKAKLTKPTKAVKDTINAILYRNERIIAQLKQEKLEESGTSIVTTDNGLILADVFACEKYYSQLQSSRKIEEGWEQLTMKVMDERFLKHMKIPYEKELAIANKELPEFCLMNYPAKTSGDQFLKALAEKHAGYVVYIDVWAPWCAPCRREMEYAAEIKIALKKYPVHYVYLCGSGGKEAQETCIKKYNLSGDHYYMENNTYKEITGKFNISGIPTFMIMDKNGVIVNQKAPRPSSKAIIVNTLKKLAKEEVMEVVSLKE